MNSSFGTARASSGVQKGARENPRAIPVYVGPFVRSRHTRPCPTYFEISFLENKDKQQVSESAQKRLDAIVFRNFYCSHISIKQCRAGRNAKVGAAATNRPGGSATLESDPWVTILRDRALMENPHFEDDAQDWHVISVEEFDQELYDPDSMAPLRVYLYQPSPMWKTISLQHVKCVYWSRFSDGRIDAEGCGKFGHEHAGSAPDHLPADGSGVSAYTPENLGSHLGELCRSIGDQVRIFGGRDRTGGV